MADPYVGEIRMFAGIFAPRGWAFCNGQLLSVSENAELFALLGTTYGGQGVTSFAVPDMRGRLPIHQGQGPGLTYRPLGSRSGAEKAYVTVEDMPAHSHGFQAMTTEAAKAEAALNLIAGSSSARRFATDPPNTGMNPAMVADYGATEPHCNLMPSLCVNFIIALTGRYPDRN